MSYDRPRIAQGSSWECSGAVPILSQDTQSWDNIGTDPEHSHDDPCAILGRSYDNGDTPRHSGECASAFARRRTMCRNVGSKMSLASGLRCVVASTIVSVVAASITMALAATKPTIPLPLPVASSRDPVLVGSRITLRSRDPGLLGSQIALRCRDPGVSDHLEISGSRAPGISDHLGIPGSRAPGISDHPEIPESPP